MIFRFTDPNMYYQIYQNFEEVNFYRESLFQILPKSNFDMHDQLKDESIGYIIFLFQIVTAGGPEA